jgi:predicted nucleic acid-binding protein
LTAFKAFHFVTVSEEDYYSASLPGSSLRRKGISVPSTDLIIAASAIKGDYTLLHQDHHFDLIAKHSSLKSINLL